MGKIRLIRILVLCVLAACACRREAAEDAQWASLCINLRIPEVLQTKAGEETVTASSEESLINNLHIWVYLSEACAGHNAGYLLGYLNPGQGTHRLTGSEDRYFVRIPAAIAHEKPRVDVYVLANSGSMGIGNPGSGWQRSGMVSGCTLKEDYFGAKADANGILRPTHMTVPGGGLPMSALAENLEMKGEYPVVALETVTLQRAVSKFRVVVSQLTDAVGPVVDMHVDEVGILGGSVATREYLFNNTANPWSIVTGDAYIAEDIVFPESAYATVAHNPSPQDYAYNSSLSGPAYEELVNRGVAAGLLTDAGTCYLRETDGVFTGYVKYTLAGMEHTCTFSTKTGMFSRNHSWIVYVYFLRDRMEFTVSWSPWEPGQEFVLS